MTQEQRNIINQMNDYKRNIMYCNQKIEDNSKNLVIQEEYKRRKENLESLVKIMKKELDILREVQA